MPRLLGLAVWLVLAVPGCGLTLDLDPPDPMAFDSGRNELDAGSIDAGEVDAGDVDAGEVDAGETDAGPPCAVGDDCCGNGIIDIEEACDDGNADAGDGCEADCTYTCIEDSDCEDGDICNGVATCSRDRGCLLGDVLACAPSDLCHVSSCDPVRGCFEATIDGDGDGHAPIVAGASMCGDDCNDSDPESWQGAPERCDGDDDDCDEIIDEDIATFLCRPDVDGDGFGSTTTSVSACTCADGSTTVGGDCFDRPSAGADQVRPTQDAFFSTPYCIEAGRCVYDYDCDGTAERRWEQRYGRCTFVLLSSTCVGSGYEVAVPACGAAGTWVECSVGLGLGGTLLCNVARSSRTQECR